MTTGFLKIISAGAGSGKTYRLTKELVEMLASGEIRAGGIIATTFTKKAAAELQERVRVRLLEEGLTAAANDLANALIGTVHGLGVKLLKRFAFEAGVSPQVDIIADEDQQVMFNQSLAMVLTHERVEEMELLASRLGLNKSDMNKTDWRKVLKELTEVVRANDFSKEVLEKSKRLSWESFLQFLLPESGTSLVPPASYEEMETCLDETVNRLENSGDTTKTTADGVKTLKEIRNELNLRGALFWHQWVKISKTKVGAKSREHLEPLTALANTHLNHPAFQNDIKSFIFNVFDLAQAAIEEYDSYKKRRGLIDYTDMEVLVKRLVDDPSVSAILAEEIDLLMVDEFQDTSPIQLELFLKLSRLAKISVWVGDPKQSIYGFRGAEPALMDAIIQHAGGLKKENILEHSWRSREDIVFLTNAIFTQAFAGVPPEQVALQPKRRKTNSTNSTNSTNDEPPEMDNALIHWHFQYDGEGKTTNKEWFANCIATTLKTALDRGMMILPKGEKQHRLARPGDVAVLCRTNYDCQELAEALHRAGLQAAISRAGLLRTAEGKLILACLKFILNKYDSLSIAEILLLAGRVSLEDIVADRLDYLEMMETEALDFKWGEQNAFIKKLNILRSKAAELSGSEILHLLLEELDLRRLIASWSNTEQRLANIAVLCSLSLKYEIACNRLHVAASLGGFLLWLNDLENDESDMQGSGEHPDAVNLLTYHRSKGLEYPVVICHNLENVLRGDVWGVSIVQEKEDVDLNNLLGNRWLRYWVNPYADQFRNTALEERIEASEAKRKKLKEALSEEARLMYVGLTRARDYLVLPTRQKPPIWLNRVCHNGSEERPTLNASSPESIWIWEDEPLHFSVQVFNYPSDFGRSERQLEPIFFLEERKGKASYPPYYLDPNVEFAAMISGAQLSQEESYASPLTLPEVPERQVLGKAIAAFFVADQPGILPQERQKMAEGLLHRFEAEGLLEAEKLVALSDGFQNWMQQKSPSGKRSVALPLRLETGGRLFEMTVDIMLENRQVVMAIFNLPFIGDAKNRQKKAKDLSGSMAFSKRTLKNSFPGRRVETWAHFVLSGALIQVETPDLK